MNRASGARRSSVATSGCEKRPGLAAATTTARITSGGNSNSNDTATSLIALFRDGIYDEENAVDTAGTNGTAATKDELQQLQIYALQQLLQYCVQGQQSHEWSLIVTILPDLEALAEEENDTHHQNNKSTLLSQLAAAIDSRRQRRMLGKNLGRSVVTECRRMPHAFTDFAHYPPVRSRFAAW